MKNTLRVDTSVLPWLFPLVVLFVVVAAVFAPSPVVSVVGVVLSLAFACGGVPWYYWQRQRIRDRNDVAP